MISNTSNKDDVARGAVKNLHTIYIIFVLVLLFKEKNVRVEFTEKISFNEDVAQDDK
jgi:hypothetical protein